MMALCGCGICAPMHSSMFMRTMAFRPQFGQWIAQRVAPSSSRRMRSHMRCWCGAPSQERLLIGSNTMHRFRHCEYLRMETRWPLLAGTTMFVHSREIGHGKFNQTLRHRGRRRSGARMFLSPWKNACYSPKWFSSDYPKLANFNHAKSEGIIGREKVASKRLKFEYGIVYN